MREPCWVRMHDESLYYSGCTQQYQVIGMNVVEIANR